MLFWRGVSAPRVEVSSAVFPESILSPPFPPGPDYGEGGASGAQERAVQGIWIAA